MVSLGDTVSTYFNRRGGGGVFRISSDLNSGKKVRVFHWGGVLGKLRSWTLGTFWIFFWGGGGGFWNQIPEQGCSGEIWSKFSGSLAGWCITDSLSHTTYVETNKHLSLKLTIQPFSVLVDLFASVVQLIFVTKESFHLSKRSARSLPLVKRLWHCCWNSNEVCIPSEKSLIFF